MGFSKKSRGALLINDFDSQPHPGKGSLANGIHELIVANMGVLVSRDGCKIMWRCDLLITLTDTINANYYDSKQY